MHAQKSEKLLGGWNDVLSPETARMFEQIRNKVNKERSEGKTIYPSDEDVFRALKLTPPGRVRAVILGQDPYHGPNQANGLAFSVNPGCKLPPSLVNIFKELKDDIALDASALPECGDLTPWAKQGVLLLNTSLSVEAGKPGSHSHIGWQECTYAVIDVCCRLPQPVAFILLGAHAYKLIAPRIDGSDEGKAIIALPHPSPLSAYRGFFGGRPFSRTNEFLTGRGSAPIDWWQRLIRSEN